MTDTQAGGERRRRVLIVDDDELMNVFYKSLFARHEDEFDCRFATSGEKALEALRGQTAHALVLDWDLPGISGLTLLKALRKNPVARALRVIVVSGRGGVGPEVLALESGADDFLSKPFDVRAFIARLRALLRRQP